MSEETDENEAALLAAMSVDEKLDGYKTSFGEPLKEGAAKASKEEIIEAIRGVSDPEIPINVYDMGLIYNINQKQNGDVEIEMTLTAPTCPVAVVLPAEVAKAVAGTKGVGLVEVRLVFEPVWSLERLSDEAKAMLDLF